MFLLTLITFNHGPGVFKMDSLEDCYIVVDQYQSLKVLKTFKIETVRGPRDFRSPVSSARGAATCEV